MTNPSKTVTRRTVGKCSGHTSAGNPCGNWPVHGAIVCVKHGGKAPQVAKKALVRAELLDWGLSDSTVDPGEVLLRLVAQSSRRATHYAVLLESDFEDKQVAALVGSAYSEAGKTGEYIRGLVLLEAQERDRCANFASKALAAGIAERAVSLAERQGAALVAFIRGLVSDLGLDPDSAEVRGIVSTRMRAISA